jgi:hypothetical protein
MIGYEGPACYIISPNLQSATLDYQAMTDQLREDLHLRRVVEILPTPPLICSPLGFTPKADRGLGRIHHLSHPPATSVNANINLNSLYL